VLLAHPAVLEAAATGLPDRHYGQDILACVVLREGHACTEQDLRDFCVARLGAFKTPKVIRSSASCRAARRARFSASNCSILPRPDAVFSPSVGERHSPC
jgi:acyl-CoA synthetase (AMP-forming)/AMP-acid ligase II